MYCSNCKEVVKPNGHLRSGMLYYTCPHCGDILTDVNKVEKIEDNSEVKISC